MKKIVLMAGLMIGMWSSWAFSVHARGDNQVEIVFSNWAEYMLWQQTETTYKLEHPWYELICTMWLMGFKPTWDTDCTVTDDPDVYGNVLFTIWERQGANQVMRTVGTWSLSLADWQYLVQRFRPNAAAYDHVVIEK